MKMGLYLVLMALSAALATYFRNKNAEQRDAVSASADEDWKRQIEQELNSGETLVAFCPADQDEYTYMAVTNRRVFFLGNRADSIPFEDISWVRFKDTRDFDVSPDRAYLLVLSTTYEKIKVYKTSNHFDEVCYALQNNVKVKKSIF